MQQQQQVVVLPFQLQQHPPYCNRDTNVNPRTSHDTSFLHHDYYYPRQKGPTTPVSPKKESSIVLRFARHRTQSVYGNSNNDSIKSNTAVTAAAAKTATKPYKNNNVKSNDSIDSASPWYPNIWTTTKTKTSPSTDTDVVQQQQLLLEQRSVEYIAQQIQQRLSMIKTGIPPSTLHSNVNVNNTGDNTHTNAYKEIVHGRFMDLTCTQRGEDVLESLLINISNNNIQNVDSNNDINHNLDPECTSTNHKSVATTTTQSANTTTTTIDDTAVIRGAVMVLQSLCVMASQVGVKGPPEQLRRMVEHLSSSSSSQLSLSQSDDDSVTMLTHEQQVVLSDYYRWTADSVRRLKYRLDRTPAIQLLSALKWKQTPQGAFDLLVTLGVWDNHEDLALIRSGFPIRFTKEEQIIARDHQVIDSSTSSHSDPDTLLGIRQDLRHLKVYTIDGADAVEIDDGVSIERIRDDINDNNTSVTRDRLWIHIADAESMAPPGSDLFEMARRRVTSLYLPHGAISMFPTHIGTDLMSLNVNEDVRALSLGVEIHHDGSINESSIIVTPSLIRVSYRLTYDEVDEMLEEGIGYNEEWEIGSLLMAAKQRRAFRIRNGSSEGIVPKPIPSCSVSIRSDENEPDSIGIAIKIEVSHNASINKTSVVEHNTNTVTYEDPASSAYLLVTEAMILAGEAIGVWKRVQDQKRNNNTENDFQNAIRLPFRTQSPPGTRLITIYDDCFHDFRSQFLYSILMHYLDFKGRARERNVMMDLLESHAGMGWCHAWYARRFLESVSVKETPLPHSGLGLNCYVQWSSPIRRFSDLQVHASVKRYIRRNKVYELVTSGESIPNEITSVDLGIPIDSFHTRQFTAKSFTSNDLDKDIDYMDGIGLIAAGKKLQRQSQQYWLFEYIRRLKEKDPETTFNVVVLGCVDPERYQFAVYIKELGLEHRYLSPAGRLEPGTEFRVKVDSVTPRSGLLSFVRVV
jgi:RNB domain